MLKKILCENILYEISAAGSCVECIIVDLSCVECIIVDLFCIECIIVDSDRIQHFRSAIKLKSMSTFRTAARLVN